MNKIDTTAFSQRVFYFINSVRVLFEISGRKMPGFQVFNIGNGISKINTVEKTITDFTGYFIVLFSTVRLSAYSCVAWACITKGNSRVVAITIVNFLMLEIK
jgi:hypothetical protein